MIFITEVWLGLCNLSAFSDFENKCTMCLSRDILTFDFGVDKVVVCVPMIKKY